MNSKKLKETSLPGKQFYRNLNIEYIIDPDYMHTKRISRGFEIKCLGEYYNFYVKNDVLLLANVFEILSIQ